MARSADYWARKEHYERTGSWPETSKQRSVREAKERDVAQNGPTEQVHQVGSSAQFKSEDFVTKFVREWHEKNPGFRAEDFKDK
jgi:hypothetical protein